MASRQPPPSSFGWVEIGGTAPGGGARWAVWIALLGGKDALYRTLLVADGSASVVVEVQAQHPPVTRTLHRGGCRLLPETGDHGPIGRLFDMADEAARTALVAPERRSSPRGRATQAETASGGRAATPGPASTPEDRGSDPSPSGP